jgi:hypothetical protein
MPIIGRAHSDIEAAYLTEHGVTKIILEGEEIGRAMADHGFDGGRSERSTTSPETSHDQPQAMSA